MAKATLRPLSVYGPRSGACQRARLAQIAGASVSRRRQLSPDAALDRLKAIQLLEEVEIKDQTVIRFRPKPSALCAEGHAGVSYCG